jgi:hypothetical protein
MTIWGKRKIWTKSIVYSLSLFHHDSEELPGESLHGGDQPLASYQPASSVSESKN